jgi:hypothetical protein
MELIKEYFKKNKHKEVKQLYDDLLEIRNVLKGLDMREVRDIIETEFEDEKDDLSKRFDKCFGKLPNDNPLKKEYMILLAELGIQIYQKSDKSDVGIKQ